MRRLTRLFLEWLVVERDDEEEVGETTDWDMDERVVDRETCDGREEEEYDKVFVSGISADDVNVEDWGGKSDEGEKGNWLTGSTGTTRMMEVLEVEGGRKEDEEVVKDDEGMNVGGLMTTTESFSKSLILCSIELVAFPWFQATSEVSPFDPRDSSSGKIPLSSSSVSSSISPFTVMSP